MNILVKNTRIEFETFGKGSAVVLLHGFLESSFMWKDIVPILSKKYKVVTLDLLGHGASENHGYIHSMEDQAEIVKSVLNHLKLRKYVIIGHSMGGYITLAFAKLFPKNVKGICLLNSTALPDSKEKKINRNRAIKAVKENYKTFIKIAVPMLFSEKNRTLFKKEIQNCINDALRMNPQGITAALEGMKIRENQIKLYVNSSYPIHMVISKEDPALDYTSLIHQTKNTKVTTSELPDGHMSYIENKTEVIKILSNFIKSC
ncbi:MAG: alpha/beta fold hydrolase [Lutibacter sp.]|uniref:alpha/beta fold hydrolase n=1 Tax=Lutibacter sp. TaxID=1925666 RepID=UPI00299E6ED6|nr:alpha/beta fold hydrolase [Lutibacter sp.]MDX1830037.1 alpha/beta fold hydrolase [Lutibacter sp.]